MGKNLLCERSEEFYEVAGDIAKRLAKKYFTVSSVMEPEDVVQEVALKIVRNNIEFDESKSSFYHFIYRLINNMYIDLSRIYSSNHNVRLFMSTDAELNEFGSTIYDVTESKGLKPDEEVLGNISVEEILDNLPNDGNRIAETPLGIMRLSVRNITLFRLHGYSCDEISKWYNVHKNSAFRLNRKAKNIISDLLSLS